jgi:hypothetical protein
MIDYNVVLKDLEQDLARIPEKPGYVQINPPPYA